MVPANVGGQWWPVQLLELNSFSSFRGKKSCRPMYCSWTGSIDVLVMFTRQPTQKINKKGRGATTCSFPALFKENCNVTNGLGIKGGLHWRTMPDSILHIENELTRKQLTVFLDIDEQIEVEVNFTCNSQMKDNYVDLPWNRNRIRSHRNIKAVNSIWWKSRSGATSMILYNVKQ